MEKNENIITHLKQLDNEIFSLRKELKKEEEDEIAKVKEEFAKDKRIKIIDKLKNQWFDINNRIIDLSNYDSMVFGRIIADLMSAFEGIQYHCEEAIEEDVFHPYDWLIHPVNRIEKEEYIPPSYIIEDIEENRTNLEGKQLKRCYIPHSIYDKDSSLQPYQNEQKKLYYISRFEDYLFEYRSNNKIESVTYDDLKEVLRSFLKSSIELREQRRMEIDLEKEQYQTEYDRKKFEKSCLLGRESIYDALEYIVNNYEENMSASQEMVDTREHRWEAGYVYHRLLIKSGIYEDDYRVEIEHYETTTAEPGYECFFEPWSGYVNFFDFKKSLYWTLKKSKYVKTFLEDIEKMFLEGKKVKEEDINRLLENSKKEFNGESYTLKLNNSNIKS